MRRPDRVRPAVAAVAVAGALLGPCALLVVGVLVDPKLTRLGHGDLRVLSLDTLAFPAAMLSCQAVGAVLVLSWPRHPVGWLFLGLGDLLALDGLATDYAAYGALARPGSLPGAGVVAVLINTDFIVWLTVLALIMQLTPTGHVLSRRWGRAAAVTVLCGAAWLVVAVLRPERLDAPFQTVSNPLAIEPLGDALAVLAAFWGTRPAWACSSRPRRWWCVLGALRGWSGSGCGGWPSPRCR